MLPRVFAKSAQLALKVNAQRPTPTTVDRLLGKKSHNQPGIPPSPGKKQKLLRLACSLQEFQVGKTKKEEKKVT